MHVSVIVTVLNEGNSIRGLMETLTAQSQPADEVVIVDGGSRDETLAVLDSYRTHLPLKVLSFPGVNISQGRNRAIEAASGDVIASTDAGVRLEPGWLAALVAPLKADPALHAVAGFFVPDPQTPFEAAMGATVLPALEDVDPSRFLPSSRSIAFRKQAWHAAGGYPEWLDYCEDLIFDFALRKQGPLAFAPQAIAHFRPRGSLRAFFKQYYRYARGDGKADLWRKRHAIRYGTYLVALPLVLRLARKWPLAYLLLLAGVAGYCRASYRRLGRYLSPYSPAQRVYMFSLVPLIRLTGDLAKMLGYPVGLLWRWRHAQRAI